MRINIIAAVDANLAIGKDNRLLFWLPNDLRRFKALTTGHTIIMGRRTYESLPKGALPHRRNIVLTRSKATFPGCECYRSLEDALSHCGDDEEVFVIGGASVYAKAMAVADRLCLTEIHAVAEDADTFFPSYADWHEVAREHFDADDRHQYAYDFVDYVRD